MLLQHQLSQPSLRAFAQTLWNDLLPRLLAEAGCTDPTLLARLQAQQGRLEPAALAEGAEVLGLALTGLGSDAALMAWLQWLLQHRAWPALQRVLPALRARLEPDDPAKPPHAVPRAWRQPDARLHWLRRVLLLTCVDAGAAALPGLQQAGVPALLDAPWPAMPGDPLPEVLHQLWHQVLRPAAWQGSGQRLAHRLQAGCMLGLLGDTLRYEPCTGRAADGHWQHGLRAVRSLWARVGAPVGPAVFAIGSPAGTGYTDEQPAWRAALGGFLACRLPLTVGEWQCFHASPAGRAFTWAQQHDPDCNNPLQPVSGISWRAARAFARWADTLMADWRQADTAEGWPPLTLALPPELHWEAAVRGPLHASGAGATGGVAGDPTAFNQAGIRWLRPSPVGVFSASATPLGLQDAAGNVWEWCANALAEESIERGWHRAANRDQAGQWADDDAPGLRALRGGAFRYSSVNCRPAFRFRNSPVVHYLVIGVRLVRLWLPHSEPRTP